MSIDVVDLRNFYAQRLGTVARRFIGRGIRNRWGDTRSMRVLGIGYATLKRLLDACANNDQRDLPIESPFAEVLH